MMNERIREVKIDEVTILQDIAKRTFYNTFKSSYSDEDFNKFLMTYHLDKLENELQNKASFHYFTRLANR